MYALELYAVTATEVMHYLPHGLRRAAGEECLVGVLGGAGVIDAHDTLDSRAFGKMLELMVDEQEPGTRMLQDEADVLSVQPVIQRHQHAAGRRHPVVRFQQRRDIPNG